MPRSKIALLYVGGSIGMKANQKTGRIEPIESLDEIHRFLPALQKEVSLRFYHMTDIGSSEITPEHWTEIAETIKRLYNEFEGFVVVHGTNTMSYTAAALSFALQGLSKPVVVTGALMPINDIAGDGHMNLIFAIRAAQMDIAEVCIVMGPRVLRACRAQKVDQSILQTFDSPKFPPLADFSIEVDLHPWRTVRRKRTLVVKSAFDPNVCIVTLHPGMPQAILDSISNAKPHGIVLRTYGPGMLPESMFPWLQRLSDEKIPVVINSQTLRGSTDLHRFRKQLILEELGLISGKNMTFEAAVVKLMWALEQTDSPRRLRDLMEKDLVGELDD